MQTLTTQRISNGLFAVYWNGERTRYEIHQTERFPSFREKTGRRAPRYAISWTGKDGQPKWKVVGTLHAAKGLLAQRLASCTAA